MDTIALSYDFIFNSAIEIKRTLFRSSYLLLFFYNIEKHLLIYMKEGRNLGKRRIEEKSVEKMMRKKRSRRGRFRNMRTKEEWKERKRRKGRN